MAWTIYNRGLFEVGNLVVGAAVDLRLLILAGASIPTGLTTGGYDLNTVADVLAVSGAVEAVAAGYARADLAGVAFAEDDTNDYAVVSWTAPSWASVATGETWRAAVLHRYVSATDSTNIAWGIDVFPSGVPTNGSPVQYTGASLRIQR
jgi:hypothetical protein